MNAWMQAFFGRFGGGRRAEDDAEALHAAVVARARDTEFYEILGVPDTIEGRFEMLCVHAFLVLRRLKQDGAAGTPLGQSMVDTLFLDLDRAMREMGVSDISVGKRMKTLGQAFYGRLEAYERAMGQADELEAAVARNVFADGQCVPGAADRLATYMEASAKDLAAQGLESVRNGVLRFAALAG